ncbi:MAG: HdeD family acid-resistance protein, partial [Eubacteriales bacterium]
MSKSLWTKIKDFKWGYLLFAILFAGAGICFLSFRENALRGVKIGIGATAVVFSVIYIALTCANKERGFRFWARMVMAGTAFIAGLFFAISKESAYGYIVMIAGLYLIIDGSFKLQTAVLSKRYRSAFWWIMLALAAASITLGAVMLRRQFDFETELLAASRLLGVGLLIDGVQNLLSIGYLTYIERKTRQEVIDDLRTEGMIATVLDGDTALSKKEERARKKAEKKAARLAKGHAGAIDTTAPVEVTVKCEEEPQPAEAPSVSDTPETA